MKYLNIFIFLLLFICLFFFLACDDGMPKNCKRVGYCFAEGSYQDYGDYASLGSELNQNTDGEWERKGVIYFTSTDAYCYDKNGINIRNFPIKLNDTIFFNTSSIYPVQFKIRDYDVVADEYGIIKNEKIPSWLIIDKINADTSEISGTFQLSFKRTATYDRWDDPNRPDTLHFTNGVFEAVSGN